MNGFTFSSLAAVFLALTACGAGESQGAENRGGLSSCFKSIDSIVADSIPSPPIELDKMGNGEHECDAWHESAILRAREQLWADDPRHAELLLRNFQSANLGLEAERLFLLYAIVKTEAKVDEMARINSDLQARAPDNPYAKLVYGVQECIYGDCSSVVPELEEANRSIDVDLAKAYLAVAYAYSGRFRDAEALFDQTRGGAMAFDEAVVYVAVGTYLKVSRPDDARSLGVGYFDAHPELEGSFFRQETKKLLEMAE